MNYIDVKKIQNKFKVQLQITFKTYSLRVQSIEISITRTPFIF
jgi:hypothetical protein